jgi:hypothetical protein
MNNNAPTFEHKEDEEGKVVAQLCRVANVIEETKVVVGACNLMST